jgi:hypothetical protein
VKLCGKKVVELGHTGNDLVPVVRHNDDRLGCLSNKFAVDGGCGKDRVKLLRYEVLGLGTVLSRRMRKQMSNAGSR